MAGPLTRWDPFAELADLRSRFDRAFATGRSWTPAIDVERDDGNLVIRADVPGVKPEEVKVEFEDGVLTLHGEHEQAEERTEKEFVRRERHYGSFTRSMTLPSGVDGSAIKATTKDGVLEVVVPLPEDEGKRPVTITPTAG
jgi:HSP20 family protein